jgi:hypothetical protein
MDQFFLLFFFWQEGEERFKSDNIVIVSIFWSDYIEYAISKFEFR